MPNQPEKQDDLSNLGDFAKMVKEQLKDGYNIDAEGPEEKMDLHDQKKAILKLSDMELWFRESSDGSITIDGIKDGKAIGTVKINTPVCHLRTSAILVKQFDLVNEKEQVKNESVEVEEPEDFEAEFTAPSNKFVIIDSSAVIEGHELADEAIVVPVKNPGTVFMVKAKYDDTILRHLSITPSTVTQGSDEVVKTTKYAVKEGATLSHDDSVSVKVRTTLKSKHSKKGAQKGEVPLSVPSPEGSALPQRGKHDHSSDERYKKRKAHRPSQLKKAAKMKEELSEDKLVEHSVIIQDLIMGGKSDSLPQLSVEDLDGINKILQRMAERPELDRYKEKVLSATNIVGAALEECKKFETSAIVEHVEWMRKESKVIREQIRAKQQIAK